jgi:hypothetical protein
MCAQMLSLGLPAIDGKKHDRIARMLLAGAAAAGTGFIGFVAVHSLLIAPIWDRSLRGMPFALVAGVGLAWAFDAQERNAESGTIRAGLRFGATMFATLVPATLFANALRIAGFHPNDWPGVAFATAIAAASGATAGHLRGGRARETAVATIALTVAMAGQIPVVNSPRAAWLFAAFLPICLAAGIALAISRRLIARTD